MKYRLLPQNEGQGLNLVQHFTGSRKAACAKAAEIAKGLQALFPDATITCGVQTPLEGFGAQLGVIATPTGEFIDGINGGHIKP